MKTRNIYFCLITLLTLTTTLSAQDEPVYKRGHTQMENTLPPSPEPASAVKYADVPFTFSQGLAQYDVPFYTLQGRELSIPISLSYSSGGIKLDEIAGVAGLGWTLQAGGCVTRTVMDMPDEFTAPIFYHEMPSASMLTKLENQTDTTTTFPYLRKVLWHQIDNSLDRYSYNVCGLSGTFVIKDDGSVFQLGGDGVKIAFTRNNSGAITSFTLTGPDGTVYFLDQKETGTHDGSSDVPFTPTTGEPDRWSATTAWYLTTVTSRSGCETAQFSYNSGAQTWTRNVHARSRTLSVIRSSGREECSTGSSDAYIANSYQTKVLTGITLSGYTATFSYSTGTGNHNHTVSPGESTQNFPFRLSGIAVRYVGQTSDIASLTVNTARDSYDGRVILNNLRLYRGGVLDDRWDFTYNTRTSTVSQYSQDWYGYYNAENETGSTGRGDRNPYSFQPSTWNLQRSYGAPDATAASYMSLKSADHDGAKTTFTYEGNQYTHGGETTNIGVRVGRISMADNNTMKRVRRFTYESPTVDGPALPLPRMYTTVSAEKGTNQTYGTKYTWSFAVHETPVVSGPSIRDTRVYYGKVTEDDNERGLVINGSVRTVYTFSTVGIYPLTSNTIGRFPLCWSPIYNSSSYAPTPVESWTGVRDGYTDSGPSIPPLLVRKEDYAYSGNSYKRVGRTDYSYDTASRSSVLVEYSATQVMQRILAGQLFQSDIYHYPVYAYNYPGRNPVQTRHVEYHTSEADTTAVTINTSFVFRSDLSSPVRVSDRSFTENDVTRSIQYLYSDTWPGGVTWVVSLKNQHFLTQPLKTRYFISSSSASVPWKEETQEYSWFTVNGTQRLLPSIHTEKTNGTESWRETVLTRDCLGNVSSVKEKGRPETVILWGYHGLHPVAVIENATMSSVETSFVGGQSSINSLANSDVPNSTHTSSIEQLRSSTNIPTAHVTAFTFNPGIGLLSCTDPAAVKTSYEYDSGGRLSCVKDKDGKKVEGYTYSLLNNGGNGKLNMHHKVYRNITGTQYSEDVRWWNTLGLKLEDISIAGAGDGKDLVTAYTSDFMLHDDVKTWLPYPVSSTGGAFQTDAESSSSTYHSNTLAYSYKKYEQSSRDRVTATAVPGYAGQHESTMTTTHGTGLRKYIWSDSGSLGPNTEYDSSSIVKELSTDADGRSVSTFRDHAGRILGTSIGTADTTYYVYDVRDQLRAVASKEMIDSSYRASFWRYDYDALGRLSSRTIPHGTKEMYTYDTDDRIVKIFRDTDSTNTSETKDIEYDAFGRVTKVYLKKGSAARVQIEEHTYDSYPGELVTSPAKGLETRASMAEIGPEGTVTGTTAVTYYYDGKERPSRIVTSYSDGSSLTEVLSYTFAGDVSSATYTCSHGNATDVLTLTSSYDIRGRKTSGVSSLAVAGTSVASVTSQQTYDALGRPSTITHSVASGSSLASTDTYTLQGWTASHTVKRAGSTLFTETLGYDASTGLSGTVPLYTGHITKKTEKWTFPNTSAVTRTEGFAYDYAGRLSRECTSSSATDYEYDVLGNIKKSTTGSAVTTYNRRGYQVRSLSNAVTASFDYDYFGRMTTDGLSGMSIAYNHMDLPSKITASGTVRVKYTYLADGAKLSALNSSNAGLVYRGPFVYRRSTSGALTLESAEFEGGRLTSSGAMLHVTDHLGSVRAVMNGTSGSFYEASNYSAYGTRSAVTPNPRISLPTNITQRDRFTGQEDQNSDFSVPYLDYGARQYSPALRRWLVPDPMSEKYYGISPYAYCNNDPMNFVDPDGKDAILKIHRKYIEVSAKILSNNKSEKSLDQAISFWNNRKGDNYQGKPIVYNITKEINDYSFQCNNNDNINTYEVISEKIDEPGSSYIVSGRTRNKKQVVVEKDYSLSLPNTNRISTTGAHEIGHVLGMLHSERGIMSMSQDNNRTYQVTDDNIQEMMTADQNIIKKDLIVRLMEMYDKVRSK